jgi:hypothetical protein
MNDYLLLLHLFLNSINDPLITHIDCNLQQFRRLFDSSTSSFFRLTGIEAPFPLPALFSAFQSTRAIRIID